MAAGIGKRMDICAFYSLKIIKKNHFLLLNGSIMTAYSKVLRLVRYYNKTDNYVIE